jgi:hypothetical protein
VAEILLTLSPDDMYVLADRATRESGASAELSYEEIVRISTERVSRKLALPPFEAWVEQYRSDPSRFDNELMGLWESDLEERSQT